MNAVLAQRTLGGRQGIVQMPEMRIDVDPLKVYEFNARLSIDSEFDKLFRLDTRRALH